MSILLLWVCLVVACCDVKVELGREALTGIGFALAGLGFTILRWPNGWRVRWWPRVNGRTILAFGVARGGRAFGVHIRWPWGRVDD